MSVSIRKVFSLIGISICAAIIGSNIFAPDFCILQLNRPSPSQAMDSYLFGWRGYTLSDEEKVSQAAARGIDYPKCCSIEVHRPSTVESNPALRPKFSFFLTVYQKRFANRQNTTDSYYRYSVFLDRCGWEVAEGWTSLSTEQMEKINANKSKL